MSKKEEILHKLNTEDRNYIKKKFKEREEFCIGQVESLTNLINVLIEESKELMDEKFDLESKLAEKEKYIEEQEFAEYKEMFYATQALKEDCELKIIGLEKQLTEKDIEIENLKNANKGLCETLGMKDKDFYVVEKEEYDKMVSGAKQFANEKAIKLLNKVHKFFSKTFVGVGLNTYCERVRPVETFIIEEIKKLKGGER